MLKKKRALFFFLIIKRGGRGRLYVTYSPGRDLKGAPSSGNVGLSYSYCDRGTTDLTLAPQESQSVGHNACHENPPHDTRHDSNIDHEHAHRIPHCWATPPGARYT